MKVAIEVEAKPASFFFGMIGVLRPGKLKKGFSLSGPLVKCMILSFLGWTWRLFAFKHWSRYGYAFCSLVVLVMRKEDEVRNTPLSM